MSLFKNVRAELAKRTKYRNATHEIETSMIDVAESITKLVIAAVAPDALQGESVKPYRVDIGGKPLGEYLSVKDHVLAEFTRCIFGICASMPDRTSSCEVEIFVLVRQDGTGPVWTVDTNGLSVTIPHTDGGWDVSQVVSSIVSKLEEGLLSPVGSPLGLMSQKPGR